MTHSANIRLRLRSIGFLLTLFLLLQISSFATTCTTSIATANGSAHFQTDSEEYSVDQLISGLSNENYEIRSYSQIHLRALGWVAADQLLVARQNSKQLEQQQVINRLLQQLPSFHLVVEALCPSCPEEILQRTINFQHKTFSEKAAVVRLLNQHEDRINARSILCIIARLDSDSLIRDFAVAQFIEDLFPINIVAAQRKNSAAYLDQIPDRANNSQSSLQSFSKDVTFQVNRWINGQLQLEVDNDQGYRLLNSVSAKDLQNAARRENHATTQQADFIRHCLISLNTGQSILEQPVLQSIANRTKEAIDRPLFAATPQRFELQNEVLTRMARWCVIQTRHQSEHQKLHQQLIDCLYCLGCDADCFQSNPAVFCELSVMLEQPAWIVQWHTSAIQNSQNTPAPILALCEASFELNEQSTAEIWLHQEFLGGRSRFTALQFAILAKELGYLRSHRYLVAQLAARPLDGSTATATAKLLNAEAFAADCDYYNAATQLQWLLTELHADPALLTKVEKRLPNGLNEVRVRMQFFLAQDAFDHWDHVAALRHLSLGHSLNPLDTNILSLAWKINASSEPMPTEFQWDPIEDRISFLRSLTQPPSSQTNLGLATNLSAIPIFNLSQTPLQRNTAYKVMSATPRLLTPSSIETQLTNSVSSSVVSFPVKVSMLQGKYLQRQTAAALNQFQMQIDENEFALGGAANPAQRLQQIRELSCSLNRWAYLATSCDHQTELAYLRSRQATELATNSSAYFDTLAICCENTGRLAEAIQATRVAMSLSPHDPSYRTRLATLQNYASSEYR